MEHTNHFKSNAINFYYKNRCEKIFIKFEISKTTLFRWISELRFLNRIEKKLKQEEILQKIDTI